MTIGVIKTKPAMLTSDEKDLTILDISKIIVEFKNSPKGKLASSKLNDWLNFEGNVPLTTAVSLSEIAGAAVTSFVS